MGMLMMMLVILVSVSDQIAVFIHMRVGVSMIASAAASRTHKISPYQILLLRVIGNNVDDLKFCSARCR